MNKLAVRGLSLIILSFFLLFITGCRDDNGSSTTTNIGCGGTNSSNNNGTGKSISGRITYEDKTYNNNGFTGTVTFKPVRCAAVELVRNADSTILSSTSTDSAGAYSLIFINPGSPGVYVRVIAETDSVIVKNNINANAVFAVKSDIIDETANEIFTKDIDITISSGAGGAFNILDVLTDGVLYLKGLTVTIQPKLAAFWETNSCDGTFFDSSGNSIHLLGGCKGDTDEYDDDIILHEFGHLIAVNFSRDDSPGGEHFLNDNTEDIRLAWSEGWAHFFSSAIRGNSSHVDTVLNAASSFEIEGPSRLGSTINLNSSSVYTTSEVSVAAVLWDIFDSANEPLFDALSLGINPVWDVFSNYLISPSVSSVSIEDFWDGWFVRGHNSSAEMLNITTDRKMELFLDGFESDNSTNTTRKIAIGSTEHHTLYPAGDQDLVAFDVTQGQGYTIETLNLSNGADTYIEILGSDGITIIASNDNRDGKSYVINCQKCPSNDNTTLSSSISIVASTTGTTFVRVSRSPSAPDSAGVYGSYDLKVSSP